jgi:3-hydroxyisobutyrate dehydrogenase
MYRCLFSSTIKPTTTRCKTLLRFQSTCTTSFSSKPFLGFVGLGQMGGPMAMNLHTAGHEMVIYDVVDSNLDILRSKKGIQVASHPREVAEKCHTIITMLPSTQIVQQVYLNKKEEGFFSALEKGQLLIDSSTIDPMFTKELSLKLHEEKQVFFVDAPVSGGINGAKNATLTFMVGGKKKEFELAKPFLKQMGKNIVHCGDTCKYIYVYIYIYKYVQ